MKLSNIERFSLTHMLMSELADRENELLGYFGTRVVGFVATPFTGLIDSVAYILLRDVKFILGTIKFCAKYINPKYIAPKESEFQSVRRHLVITVRKHLMIIRLPFIALVSPSLARDVSDPRRLFTNDIEDLDVLGF